MRFRPSLTRLEQRENPSAGIDDGGSYEDPKNDFPPPPKTEAPPPKNEAPPPTKEEPGPVPDDSPLPISRVR